MHEAGLMRNVLNIVDSAADKLDIKEVDEIGLIIGKTRAIIPEGLRIGMRVYSQNSKRYANCKLNIEERDLILECPDCGHSQIAQSRGEPCPVCNKVGRRIVSGTEFKVAYFHGKELEDENENNITGRNTEV